MLTVFDSLRVGSNPRTPNLKGNGRSARSGGGEFGYMDFTTPGPMARPARVQLVARDASVT